ncbi:MAG: glycine cleavage system protein H [Anaerolineales bacterium]|nr:glycine cleavage system protein H [Anaerolineales bacterium]
MIFYACDIPENLTYDIERDVWIRFDGDFATLGMTDVAQTPFPAPFACEIVETNEAGFARDILLANKDPYGIGWLVKVKPTNLEAESSHLVTGEAAAEKYKERIVELKVNCLRCVD